MKVTANIATYPARKKSLIKMLKSIEGQFDEIRVCANGHDIDGLPDNVSYCFPPQDMADNGKFFYLDHIEEPEIFCTLDDDIEYAPNYRETIEQAIREFGCIISFHGRQLLGKGRHYYKGHRGFRCLDHVQDSEIIDIPGTGVMGFDTRYFHPKGLADAKDLRMADLVFALEAAKQGKQIGVLAHEAGWLKHIPNKETIYETETRNGIKRQNEIADEIWKLKYES